MTKKLNNPEWWNAIEVYLANPGISIRKLAKEINVH